MAATILLIPTDPTSPLLADGPCGARPPVLTWCYNEVGIGPDRWSRPGISMRPYEPIQRALVLALDGVPVAEGCDRAARVSGHPLISRLDVETAEMIGGWCARQLRCRVIVLDGGEVRDA